MQDQIQEGYQQALALFQDKKYKKSFLKLIGISNSCSSDSNYLFLLSEVQNQMQDFVARQRTLQVLCQITQKVEHQILLMKQLLQNKSVNLALDVGLQIQAKTLSNSAKAEVFDLLSNIYIQENDFEGLAEVVKSYEQEQVQTECYFYSRSLLCLNESNEIQALENLRLAVLTNKNFDQAWVALALVHEKMGDQDLAMANLEKALDVNPLNISALKHYSKKSILAGDVDKAVEKISFYLQEYNFDLEMTTQYVELMKNKKQYDIVQHESKKLSYYFGQQISL